MESKNYTGARLECFDCIKDEATPSELKDYVIKLGIYQNLDKSTIEGLLAIYLVEKLITDIKFDISSYENVTDNVCNKIIEKYSCENSCYICKFSPKYSNANKSYEKKALAFGIKSKKNFKELIKAELTEKHFKSHIRLNNNLIIPVYKYIFNGCHKALSSNDFEKYKEYIVQEIEESFSLNQEQLQRVGSILTEIEKTNTHEGEFRETIAKLHGANLYKVNKTDKDDGKDERELSMPSATSIFDNISSNIITENTNEDSKDTNKTNTNNEIKNDKLNTSNKENEDKSESKSKKTNRKIPRRRSRKQLVDKNQMDLFNFKIDNKSTASTDSIFPSGFFPDETSDNESNEKDESQEGVANNKVSEDAKDDVQDNKKQDKEKENKTPKEDAVDNSYDQGKSEDAIDTPFTKDDNEPNKNNDSEDGVLDKEEKTNVSDNDIDKNKDEAKITINENTKEQLEKIENNKEESKPLSKVNIPQEVKYISNIAEFKKIHNEIDLSLLLCVEYLKDTDELVLYLPEYDIIYIINLSDQEIINLLFFPMVEDFFIKVSFNIHEIIHRFLKEDIKINNYFPVQTAYSVLKYYSDFKSKNDIVKEITGNILTDNCSYKDSILESIPIYKSIYNSIMKKRFNTTTLNTFKDEKQFDFLLGKSLYVFDMLYDKNEENRSFKHINHFSFSFNEKNIKEVLSRNDKVKKKGYIYRASYANLDKAIESSSLPYSPLGYTLSYLEDKKSITGKIKQDMYRKICISLVKNKLVSKYNVYLLNIDENGLIFYSDTDSYRVLEDILIQNMDLMAIDYIDGYVPDISLKIIQI